MRSKKYIKQSKNSTRASMTIFSRAVTSCSSEGLILTFFLFAIAITCLVAAHKASASNPAAGTIAPAGASVTWNGFAATIANPTASEATCQEGSTCDTYKLTVSGTPADWAGKRIHIDIRWIAPAFDYALSVHKGTNADPVLGYSDNDITTPRNFESVDIDPSVSGIGEYSLHAIYFTTSDQDPYVGTASITDAPPAGPVPTPAPRSTEPAPRYFNYTPPAGLGDHAGEPSIGVNWKTGKVFFLAGFETLRVNFDDTSSPARATWENKSPTTHVSPAGLDPILFTDSRTGRTFSSQLLGATSDTAFSDNDGETWSQSQGAGIPASLDHQTLGGGPFAPPLTRDPSTPLYRSAVYYCSQDLGVDASCAMSLDGGQTFGPAIRIYTQNDCEAGLHGHIKVAPDGTAYVPVGGCQGEQAVVTSENNGLTWDVRKIPNSGTNSSDPSVGIAKDGTLYFAFADEHNRQRVAVSRDKGHTWTNDFDIGAQLGIKNSVFPSAVAGDKDRAAVFFLGTTTPGLNATAAHASDFDGAWYGYISTTYDGGKSWVTVNATANDPVQRGPVCDKGTSAGPVGCQGNTRNLLDFNDLTVDLQGRPLAAYADGCVCDACIQGRDINGDNLIDGNENDGTDRTAIIRLAGGKGLFSEFDVALISITPAPPLVVASLDDQAATAYVSWSTPDDGGSPITGYKIYRGTVGGPEALLASVGADTHSLTNESSGTNVYYRASAVNANGEGEKSPRILASVAESPCKGTGITVLTDAVGDSLDRSPQHDIRSLHIAEPYFMDGSSKLIFTLKMAGLSDPLTPNTQWRIYFTGPNGSGYFVDMRTDALSAVTYKYGTYIHNADNTQGTSTTVGNADAGSRYDAPTGVITLVVSNDKIGNPHAGDTLSRIFVRIPVVAVVPDNANYANPSSTVAYTLVGNASCQARPAAPTSLMAFSANKREVGLYWQDKSDNENSFLIERSTSVASGFTQIATVGANVVSYVDSGVVRKTTYYYRVRGVNGGGKSTYSNVASARVK